MSTVLNNFVTIRKNRGDVLTPTEYRSIVEMIRGILKRYDFAGFNDSYKSLLDHLANYSDPHRVTENGFLEELIVYTYSIYVKMTHTPLSEVDFRAQIVPNLAFVELIRRIVLNHWMYLNIKNDDGTVDRNVTLILNSEWGYDISPSIPVTVTFPFVLVDEDAFISQGINTNSTPIPIVFNATDLTLSANKQVSVFHTSLATPYEVVGGVSSGYSVALAEATNDFTVELSFKGNQVATTTTLLTFTNGTSSLFLKANQNGTVNLLFNTTTIAAGINCNNGSVVLKVTRDGTLVLNTEHNTIRTVHTYTVNFSAVAPFNAMIVGLGLCDVFETTFGMTDLTLYKEIFENTTVPDVIPIIIYTPPSGGTAVEGTASFTAVSSPLIAINGYKLYLTLTGTWSGWVLLERSRDNGVTWRSVTTHGGNSVGALSQNCDESLLLVDNPDYRFRLQFQLTSGSVNYRLAQ